MKSTEAVKPVEDAQVGHFRIKVMEVVEPMLRAAGYDKLQAAFSVGSKMKELLDGAQALAIQFLDLNPFAGEVVEPDADWNYDNITLPPPEDQITKQLAALGLSSVQAILVRSENTSTENADGLMAIPFLTDLGTIFGVEDPLGTGYGSLGEEVFEKIAAIRAFYNYLVGQMNEHYVRLNADARERLQTLESKTQPEEGKLRFHILPVSMGASLAGYSPRNARVTALLSNRLPLGFVQIACLLLGWPERLNAYEQSWIDCSADEWDWGAGGRWTGCPYFRFYDGRLKFDARVADGANAYYVSPVASPGV